MMGKFLKIIGWTVGIIVVLLVVAVIVLPQIIDPNDYKDQIVEKVRLETGRTLRIDGDVGLSVLPWLGIEISAMELSNAKGFEGIEFASVEHAAVRVKLMPLLSRQLEVDTIGLKGLKLNLAKAKDGTTNWDDMAGGGSAQDAQPKASDPATTGTESESKMPLEAFTIRGVDISDARISWQDQSAGQTYIVDKFNLKTGALARGKPVDLTMSMMLEGKEAAITADVELNATISVDESADMVDVSGLKLQLNGKGESLPGGQLEAVLEAVVKLAMNGESLDVSGLKLSAAGLDVTGGLKGKDLTGAPTFSGDLQLAELDLRQWLADQGVASVSMADPKALTRVGVSLTLENKGSTTRFNDLLIQLDDTRIDGTASLQGSAVGFKLNVDAIDLDRYMPPSSAPAEKGAAPAQPAASEAPASTPPAASAESPLLPVETLRGLNIDGVLNVGKLIVSKLLAEQLQVTVKAKDGKLALGQQVKKFYQGGYKGRVDLDVRGKTPLTKIDAAASGIQIGPLLKDLVGKDQLTGKGRFSANLNTRGNSIPAFKRDLGGKLNFRFEEGAVKGFNLAQLIREAKARFKGQPIPKSNQPLQTDFSEISASGVITKGVLVNKDLLAKSPFIRVTGKGKVSLVPETLDYKVTAVVVSTAAGQGGKDLQELKGVNIPVHLTGPYGAPKVTVDWARILLESQKGNIKKQIEKKLEGDLKDKVPAELQDKLKGFFK
ncbi:MAG: AsmA family protein [Gammaproteobacteria bacterium]|nr:AsmA family protein [Gammaproteobacteria bacterium]